MTKESIDSHATEASDQDRIKRLEKRLKYGKVGTFVGVLAATGLGFIGAHELDKKYVAHDNRQETAIEATLLTRGEAYKGFKIFKGEVNFVQGVKIYESPEDSLDNPSNIVDGKKIFKGVINPDGNEYESRDCMHVYYPVVVEKKVVEAQSEINPGETIKSKYWFGFEVKIDGEYHLYWLSGTDLLSAQPDNKKHEGLSKYDSELPQNFYAQATFDNEIDLN
jgi:hypothetical protein